jgi:hypothetical protein
MVTSELGVAHVVNADNGVATDGAMWDFIPLVEGNVLAPGSMSDVKSLRFRLTDVRPFRQPNGTYKWIFADVNAIVMGQVQSRQLTGTR